MKKTTETPTSQDRALHVALQERVQQLTAELADARTREGNAPKGADRRALHESTEVLETDLCRAIVQLRMASGEKKTAIAQGVSSSWRTVHRLLTDQGKRPLPAFRRLILAMGT